MTLGLATSPSRDALGVAGGYGIWCEVDDSGQLDRTLEALHKDPAPDVRVVRVRPSRTDPDRARFQLATDVATAIGINVEMARGEGNSQTLESLVGHLLGSPIRHLIIAPANWNVPAAVADLVTACRAAQVTAWLCTTSTLDPKAATYYATVGDPISLAGLTEAFSQDPVTEKVPAIPSAWDPSVTIPTSDFVTFLADCRAQLTTAQADLVECELLTEYEYAASWLADNNTAGKRAVASQLRERWNTCVSWSQRLTRLRGWQLAAFDAGSYLRIDAERVAGTAAAAPSAAMRRPHDWARLEQWRNPSKSAACALVAAGIGSQTATSVTIGDITSDGRQVQVEGQCLDIEPGAAPYLARARLSRLLAGAGDGAPVMVSARNERVDWRWVTKTVHEARRCWGLALPPGEIGRTSADDQWGARIGMTLGALA